MAAKDLRIPSKVEAALAYTLSDPHSDEELFKDVTWAVFETDEDDKPVRQMNCLHEYYGLVDPDRGDA